MALLGGMLGMVVISLLFWAVEGLMEWLASKSRLLAFAVAFNFLAIVGIELEKQFAGTGTAHGSLQALATAVSLNILIVTVILAGKAYSQYQLPFYLAGQQARLQRLGVDECPYERIGGRRWLLSRVQRSAWLSGWRQGDAASTAGA